MHSALCIFDTDYSIPIDVLAREAEQRGYESLWVPEHTHIPASRRTPFPAGEPLPKEYSHTLDPFVSLTVAASVTTKLKVGTGICLVIERDPIITAKLVASVDHVSNGRFLFGIGRGWNAEEMENHGTDFKTRSRRMRESVLAMKEIWTKDEASYKGEFISFDRIWAWPKAVQKPHPPVLLGGEGPLTIQRVVEYCDGWFPRGRNPEVVLSGMKDLEAAAKKAGRDPKSLTVSAFGAPPDPAVLDRFRQAGVTRAIFRLPSEGRDKVLPLLDQWAKLIR